MDELTLADKSALAKQHTKINALLQERKELQDECREHWDAANALQKKVDELDKRITEEAIKVQPTVSVKGVPRKDNVLVTKVTKLAKENPDVAKILADLLNLK